MELTAELVIILIEYVQDCETNITLSSEGTHQWQNLWRDEQPKRLELKSNPSLWRNKLRKSPIKNVVLVKRTSALPEFYRIGLKYFLRRWSSMTHAHEKLFDIIFNNLWLLPRRPAMGPKVAMKPTSKKNTDYRRKCKTVKDKKFVIF